MTRGSEPKFGDTPYARFVERRLTELRWQQKDLAAAILKAAQDSGQTRLGPAGADAVARRACQGVNVLKKNRELLDQVLGEPTPPALTPEQQEFQAEVLERLSDIQRLLSEDSG